MDWPGNDLTELLGIRYPLIQAPMAGIGTPELVAAVSGEGALGSLGGGMLPPEKLREEIRAVRSIGDGPLNVNLFAPLPPADAGDTVERMQEWLAPWRERFGLAEPGPVRRPDYGLEDQLAVVLDEGAEVFSFTFGIPPEQTMRALRDAGIKILGTATTVQEAIQLEAAGCDAVVAQGSEAGGHRGTFAASFEDGLIPMAALVAAIAGQVGVPVIAAGAIMDGGEIAAALEGGAAGAQLGTAYMATDESGAPPAYKRSLLEASGKQTTITRAFSGRPMRALRTSLVDELEGSSAEIPPYPLQMLVLADLRAAGLERNELDVVGRLTGEGVGDLREGTAAELTRSLIAEAEAAIEA